MRLAIRVDIKAMTDLSNQAISIQCEYTASQFWLCIAGYVVAGYFINSSLFLEIHSSGWRYVFYPLIALPMFVAGLMMQIVQAVYLEHQMSKSRITFIRQRSSWATGICLLALVIYGIAVFPDTLM